jgi:hypothetical protein
MDAAGERKRFTVLLGLLATLLFVPHVHAQQAIDIMTCADATTPTIVSTPELTAFGYEGRGINLDNLATKTFDNMTVHTVAVFKVESGKLTGTMYVKYMDSSGDFFVVEVIQVGMERDWKFLYGNGKWKGITGAGKSYPFTKAKPIVPNTSQSCTKIVGTYELPK